MLASAVASTAAGVAGALALPFGLGIPLAYVIAAMGLAQLAIIQKLKYKEDLLMFKLHNNN